MIILIIQNSLFFADLEPKVHIWLVSVAYSTHWSPVFTICSKNFAVKATSKTIGPGQLEAIYNPNISWYYISFFKLKKPLDLSTEKLYCKGWLQESDKGLL